jgi:hypothetical protein
MPKPLTVQYPCGARTGGCECGLSSRHKRWHECKYCGGRWPRKPQHRPERREKEDSK